MVFTSLTKKCLFNNIDSSLKLLKIINPFVDLFSTEMGTEFFLVNEVCKQNIRRPLYIFLYFLTVVMLSFLPVFWERVIFI